MDGEFEENEELQDADIEVSGEHSNDASETVTDQEQGSQPGKTGFNPVWEPIRNELGLNFETIKPHLLEIDKGYNAGITKANARYAPWKPLAERGLTPEAIDQQLQVLQRMNDNPEEVYKALGQFLEENGRLPRNDAEAKKALEDADDDEFMSDEARQIVDLQKKIDDLQKFTEAQQEQAQMAQVTARAEEQVAKEYASFEQAHPDLSEEDKREIYQRHWNYAAAGPQHIKPLEDVAKEYFALVERIRSAPRPNDRAPKLPGLGGGVPTGQSKDPSEFSRSESQDALVALLQANRT